MAGSIDRGDYEVFFTAHALIRAVKRGISWDEIENAVRTGEFKRMKNDRVNIEKLTPLGKMICVCIEFQPQKLKVITIERNGGTGK